MMPGTQISSVSCASGDTRGKENICFPDVCLHVYTHREKLNLVYYQVKCICDLDGAFSVTKSHLQVEWTFHTWFWEKRTTIFDLRSVNFPDPRDMLYSKGMDNVMAMLCQLPNSLWWIPLRGKHLPSKGSILQWTAVLLSRGTGVKRQVAGRKKLDWEETHKLTGGVDNCPASLVICNASVSVCVWGAWHSAVSQHQVPA